MDQKLIKWVTSFMDGPQYLSFFIGTKICHDCKNDLSTETSIFEEYSHLRRQIYIFFVEPTEDLTRYDTFFNDALKVFHPYDSTFMDFMKNFRGLWAKKGEFARCYQITQMILKNLYHNIPFDNLFIFSINVY